MNISINYNEVIEKMKKIEGCNSDSELAEKVFKISKENLSQKKKKGSILSDVVDWAINKNINLDWLLSDRGEMYLEEKPSSPARESAILRNLEKRMTVIEEILSPPLNKNSRRFYDRKKNKKRGKVIYTNFRKT